MNFAAINASIALREAQRKRETSPLLRQLIQSRKAASVDVRESSSGIRVYTKRVPNRTALGEFKSDKALNHEISLPFVSILGGEGE